MRPRNDKGLTGRIWGCWGTALHSGTLREALQASRRSFQKSPAALRSPLRAVSGQLNPAGALILEAGTAQVALLSGLRGPQVLGREARLHTPAWLPSLPAPLLCNWGLPAPPYFTHTVLSACSSPTPRPAWELPFPRDPLRPSASLGALVPAQHPFLPAHSVHGPPVVRLLVLPPLLHLHRHYLLRAHIPCSRDSSRGSPS